jgi:hypothetical protein
VAGSGRRSGVPVEGGGGLGGGLAARGGGEGGVVGAASERKEKHDVEGGDPAGDGRHHPFKVGQRGTVEGGRGKSSDAWRGMRRGGLALIGGGQLGRRGNGPVTARAGGAGSLTSGARLAVGGRGGERCRTRVGQPGKEMEWGEPRENAKAGSG